MYGDQGNVNDAKDSVALIIGIENDTEIIIEPPLQFQVSIVHSLHQMVDF